MYEAKKIEDKWQKKWATSKAFEPKVDKKKKKFFFTVPYPYVSGSLHIGHAYAFVQGDVRARFMRMRDYNVLYPIAFHISGTPVLGISCAIANNDKKMIDLYSGYVRDYVKNESKVKKIIESFKDPQKIVDFFVPKYLEEFPSLGLSIDCARAFTSGDIEHQAMVTWQFKNYNKMGFLTKGDYPVLYCLNDKNAVGEDDIKDADINPVEKQEFTLLKFKMPGGEDKFLVAATLRPETVFGQTNLWIKPEAEYVTVKVKEEKWIMSKEAFQKLAYQRKDISVIETKTGKDYVGIYAHAPGVHREIIVLPSKFVDPGFASGVVTSVPSDAPYDYMALKDLKGNREEIERYGLDYDAIQKMELIPIIYTPGYGEFAAVKICEEMNIKSQEDPRLEEATQIIYKAGFHTGKMIKNCGEFNEMPVIKAKDEVKKNLIRDKDADVFYETSRSAVCRCGGKIIVAVLPDQWFLDFNHEGWKEKARACLAKMEIKPDIYRKQFEDTFDWLDKRPVARRRGLGTKLPMDKNWVIESLSDSTIYMSLYTINDLIKKLKIKGNPLTEEFFDYVYLGKGTVKDASKKTKAPAPKLKKLREAFDYWYPVDQRHTFTGHLSNHLSFFIFAHAALFPEKYWPKKITFHGYIMSEGEKMSKSKGNIVTLKEIKDKYGADVFRAYVSSVASVDGNFDWRAGDVVNMQKNITNAYVMLENLAKNRKKGKLSLPSQAFISFFESSARKATEALEVMDHRNYAMTVLYDIPNAYKRLEARVPKHEIAAVNSMVAEKWIKMLAPMAPHIAEEIWQQLGKRTLISLETWPEFEPKLIKPEIEESENLVASTAEDINAIIKLICKKPSEIKIIIAPEWKNNVINTAKELMSVGKRDFKSIMAVLMKNESMRKNGGEITRILTKITTDASKIPKVMFGEKKELEIFKVSKSFFEKEFNCKVTIEAASESKEQKANSAMPAKPAIVIV
jgi:leucyl-tRNA synthetase